MGFQWYVATVTKCDFSATKLANTVSYSHQAKVGTKAIKIKEQEEDQRKNGKHQRKFSLLHSLSLGPNIA